MSSGLQEVGKAERRKSGFCITLSDGKVKEEIVIEVIRIIIKIVYN